MCSATNGTKKFLVNLLFIPLHFTNVNILGLDHFQIPDEGAGLLKCDT
jgi:hypothetical protein